MYLKALTLAGFKSFAARTDIDFEPGITVIVGPNGSGKSNLVDAITWVLGVRGPRALRSNAMDDVIFAGLGPRGPLGRAEVTLVLDNEAGVIPIQVAEVAITRRLYRSGESEYELNGEACRLLDIQEVLSDAGVGRHLHAIVGQGQLDAVLTARPEDHRAMIEEAAGVLKHRRRKERSLRRLADTEANMLRLTDLLREMRRQLRPLRRQAEAADEHDAMLEEQRRLRLYLAGEELRRLDAVNAALARDRDTLSDAVTRHDAEHAHAAAEVDAHAVNLDEMAEALDGARATRGRLATTRERLAGLVALLEERDRQLAARVRQARGRVTAVSRLADVAAEAASLAAERDELASLEARLGREVRVLADELTALEAAEAYSPQAMAVGVRAELAAWEHERDRLATAATQAHARVADVEKLTNELASELTRAEAAALGAEAILETQRTVDDEARARDAQAAAAAHAAQEVRRNAAAERAATAARLHALHLLGGEDAHAVRARLATVPGVAGRVEADVQAPPELAGALAAALGRAAHALLVRPGRMPDLARAAQAEGVPLDLVALAPSSAPDVHAAASTAAVDSGGVVLFDTLAGPAEARDALRALLGDVVVVADLDLALRAAGRHPLVRFVTRDGDVVRGGHVRVGRAPTIVASVADAARDAETAEVRAAEADRRAASAQEEATRAQAAARAAREARTTAERGLHEAHVAVSSLRQQHGQARRDAETARAQGAAADAGLADTEARLAPLHARLAELEELCTSDDPNAATRRRARVDGELATARKAHHDAAVALGSVTQRLDLLERERATLADVPTGDEDVASLDASREEARQLATHTRSLADVLDRRLQEAVATERTLLDDREALIERRNAAREQRDAAEEARLAAREQLGRVEVDVAQAQVRREAAEETLRRDLDTDARTALAAEAPPLPDGFAGSHAERARQLGNRLRELGPVNPLAVEEFRELDERVSFVERELEDVRNARRDLTRVVREVDTAIVDIFHGAYDDVAREFRHTFGTLFPGGVGGLALTQPDDLLESGVDLLVRPAGKRTTKLSLLSGGERSLAALAFLFAIFRARPSPFYVLDEVEAALDDVNLHRFLTLVDEARDHAQLLIVTHQKGTMEVADSLYGVSLSGEGTSTVLSERLDRGRSVRAVQSEDRRDRVTDHVG